MTRQEFIDNVNSFWELIEFCNDEQLDTCADIIDSDYLDEYLMRAIRQDFDTWQGIRDYLSDIPTGGEYYAEDGYGNITCVDDMFDDYKADVIRTMDQRGAWDEEEDEEEEESFDDEENWPDPFYNDTETGDESSDMPYVRVIEEEIDIDDASFLAVVGRSA